MKHCRAEAHRVIDASPEDIWTTIARMTDMEAWYPAFITSSFVDTSGKTPKRHCVMQDGGELHERILVRDPNTRTFTYAIDAHPLPAENVVGTLRVDAVEGGAHVTWDAQFTTDPKTASHLSAVIGEMYRAGLESLANHHTA